MNMTPERIREIEGRYTSGPEDIQSDPTCAKCGETCYVPDGLDFDSGVDWCWACCGIAATHARQDIPALLAALKAVTAERDALRKACEATLRILDAWGPERRGHTLELLHEKLTKALAAKPKG